MLFVSSFFNISDFYLCHFMFKHEKQIWHIAVQYSNTVGHRNVLKCFIKSKLF